MRVAAAIIQRDGLFLICQRGEADTHPFKWEFAGGKVEQGEDCPQCLQRELREELGIEAVIGREMERITYQYPGKPLPITLLFYSVTEFQGEPQNLVFADIRWVPRQELASFD